MTLHGCSEEEPQRRLIAKARLCEHFDEACQRIVENLFVDLRQVGRNKAFFHASDDTPTVFLICSGWAARVVQLVDGRRQITELFLPGDLFPVHASMSLCRSGDSIVALNTCHVATCGARELSEASLAHANLARTLWWLSQRDVAILRTWMAVNGQYRAYERIGHLLCEIAHRLQQVGAIDGSSFEFPLTQQDLGDLTGMTPVHVNRILKELRGDGLIRTPPRRIEVPDLERLRQASNFDPAYLQPQ